MAGDWQGRVGLRRRWFLPTLGRPQPFPSSASPPPSRAVFTRASPSPQRPSFVFSLWTTRCPSSLRRYSPLRGHPVCPHVCYDMFPSCAPLPFVRLSPV